MDPNKIYKKAPEKFKFYHTIARNIAVIAGIFSLIICIFIIANFIQIKKHDPLNLPEIEKFIDQVKGDQENQSLKNKVRELDMLARRAYFSSLVFTKRGAYLLLGGVMILLIALRVMSELKQKLPDPGEPEDAEKALEAGILTRWAVGGLGAALVIVSLILPFFIGEEFPLKKDDKALQETVHDIGSGVWPGFRGPGGIGISQATNIPVKWNGKTGEGIIWKTEVPNDGVNSPVVWGKYVFLSGADEEVYELFCFDSDTGKILWQRSYKNSSSKKIPDITEDTGFAAPGMTTDGIRIFAFFALGDLVCLDFKGKEVWKRDFGVPKNHYGHSSSLIIYKGLLLVQFDHGTGAKFFALNTRTGRTVWEQKREYGTSWASPVLVKIGSRMEVILNASPMVVSYDPATGSKLWEVKCMDGEVGPSLGYAEGIVFAGNEYATLAAIEVKNAKVIWENLDDLPDVSSPVAVKGYLFVSSSGGTVTCFNFRTGDVLWKEEFEDGFYSSPVYADGKIYLMDIKGKMYIFKADKKYKLLAQSELGEPTMTTPAFVNGRIYIRGEDYLYCIGADDD